MKQDRYGLGYKPNAKARSKMKKERKMASLVDATVKGEHMVFPHLCETFYSVGVEHDDIRPSETTVLEDFEKLTINVIEGIEVKREDARAMVHPMSPESALMNWTAQLFLLFSLFHSN